MKNKPPHVGSYKVGSDPLWRVIYGASPLVARPHWAGTVLILRLAWGGHSVSTAEVMKSVADSDLRPPTVTKRS